MEMKRIYGFRCQATTGRVSNPNHIYTHTPIRNALSLCLRVRKYIRTEWN